MRRQQQELQLQRSEGIRYYDDSEQLSKKLVKSAYYNWNIEESLAGRSSSPFGTSMRDSCHSH